MGIFDRFRRPKGVSSGNLVTLVRTALERPSDDLRNAVRAALGERTLLLAVEGVPPGVGDEPAALEEDTVVSVLTTTNTSDEKFLLAFTTPEQLQARAPGSPFVGMSAEDALRTALDDTYAGIVIDPAGDWIEVRRDAIDRLLTSGR